MYDPRITWKHIWRKSFSNERWKCCIRHCLKKGFLKNVQKTSIYFHNELKRLHSKYPTVIREIRGVGLLVGIQIYKNQIEFIKKLFDRGLLTVKASENVVRLLPPLTVKKKNIDEAVEILEKVCKTYK